MKILDGFTPHAHLVDNPLFVSEARRAHWGNSTRALISYGGGCLLLVCGLLLVVWLPLTRSQNASLDFILMLFGLSWLLALALDYACFSSSLSSIQAEVSAGHWDLLRLTSLSDSQIVTAKQGMAQVRTWRLTIGIVALRIAVLIIAFLTAMLSLYRDRPLDLLVAIDVVFLAFGYGWIVVILAVIYVVEPFWRMRAMTALGVAISTRTQHFGLFVAFGVVTLIWLLQGLAGFFLFHALSSLAAASAQTDRAIDPTVLYQAIFLMGLVIPTVYGFYSLLQSWSLRRAETWIARVN